MDEPRGMPSQTSIIKRATVLAIMFLTTLWLAAQPKTAAEQLFDYLDRINPKSVLLVPLQGQAVEVKEWEDVERFFKGETPGRLFLIEEENAVVEVGRVDGKWNAVWADGSQVSIDDESFNEQFVKQVKGRKDKDHFTSCKTNLKNIGTALSMYSTDWGHYPPVDSGLSLLTPNYFRALPACPAAGKVTYSYKGGPEAELNGSGHQDYYEVRCVGANHKAVGVTGDLPAYCGDRDSKDSPNIGIIDSDERLAEAVEYAKRARAERAKEEK